MNIKLVKELLWNTSEVILSKGGAFIIGIILARILDPSDFGLMGIAIVFITFAQIFLSGGFINALVQKKDISNDHYSSVLIFILVLSSIFCVFLLLSSKTIANYFSQPQLTDIINVLSVSLVFNALYVVFYAQHVRNLNFKLIAKISIGVTLVSGVISIVMAIGGFGVWSLVLRTLISSILFVICYWLSTSWKPSWVFKMDSFNDIFRKASRMLMSDILRGVFDNIHQIVIGKLYSINDVGYYTKASQLQKFPSNNLYYMLSTVMFPYLSKLQDDSTKYLSSFKWSFNILAFVSIPAMGLLYFNSDAVIEILLTSRWMESSNYFKILCIGGAFIPLNLFLSNAMDALGRVQLTLNLNILEKVLIGVGLFLSINQSIIVMLWVLVLSIFVSFIIRSFTFSYINKTSIVSILTVSFLFCLVTGFLIMGFTYLAPEQVNAYLQIIVSSALFVFLYFGLCSLMNILPFQISDLKKVRKGIKNGL